MSSEEEADPIRGRETYNYLGNRVVEARTSEGNPVASKVKPREIKKAIRLEALMLKYASEQPTLLVPRYRGCYRVGKYDIVIVTDLVRSVSLDKAWHSMTREQRDSINTQLREQVQLFRRCTQSFIGRIGHHETSNFYERLGTGYEFIGPFESEEEFDNWCLERVRSSFSRAVWKSLLPGMRESSDSNFCLDSL